MKLQLSMNDYSQSILLFKVISYAPLIQASVEKSKREILTMLRSIDTDQ